MNGVIQWLLRFVTCFVVLSLLTGCSSDPLPPSAGFSVILTLRVPTEPNVPLTESTVVWVGIFKDEQSDPNPHSDAGEFDPMNIGLDTLGQPVWVVDVVSKEVSFENPAQSGPFGFQYGNFTGNCDVALNTGLNRINFTIGKPGCATGPLNFP